MAKAVAKDKEHRQLHATQRAAAKAAAFSKPLWPNAPVPEPTPTSSSSSTIPAYAAEDDDRSVESMDTPFPDQSLVAKAVEKDKERRQLRAAQRAAAKAATISKRMWPETASTVSPTAVGLVCFDTSCQSLRSLDNKSGEEYVAKRTTIQAAASNPHSQTMHSKQDRSSLDKCYQMDHRMNMQQALSSFEEVYGKVKSAHTSAASEHSLLSMKAVGKYSNQQERADIFLRAAAKAVASRAIEPSKQNWTMDEIMNTFVAADQAAFSSRAKQFTEDRVMRQIHVPRNVSRPAQNLE
jgi:surface antigen